MVQRSRLRRGQQALLRATNGATFPPIGRVGSWRSRRPTVQRFHLWQGREPVPWEANGAVFPPATRPAGAADSDERYSVPTYGRAGSRCPGRPTVQRSHLWQGREPVPWAANGATFPPTAGPGAGALGGQRCSVPTYGRAGSRCPGRPTVQRSHLSEGSGAGARGGQRCNVPTYRKGRELALEEANGATFPPIGRVGSWRSRRPTVQRSHLSEGSGAGARGGQRCNVPTYRKGRELALEEANGATFPPMAGPGARALGSQRCSIPTCDEASRRC